MRLPASFFTVLYCAALAGSACAQVASDLWQDVAETSLVKKAATSVRTVAPRVGRTVRVDPVALGTALGKAPREFGGAVPAEVSLPMPDGTLARFAVEDSPLMERALASKYLAMKTYVARGLDHPGWTARLDQTPQGFHAMILADDGVTFFIDPYWSDDTATYITYRKRDYVNRAKEMTCFVSGQADPLIAQANGVILNSTGTMLRTYRLAVACTGEYAAVAGNGTVNGALGAILTTVNRVSGIYERDFAIRLKLVANEDQIIFTNAATDGFTNNDAVRLLSENQSKIDAVIGNGNYDLGHVFSAGGGGLSNVGVVGVTSQKARGKSGTNAPVGDPYDVDFVAHEMGHQFGANHPFNATSTSCSGSQRNGATAYEPGFGSTIMAYAGTCTSQNLAAHSDAYFHSASYSEIDAYASSLPGTVGTSTATGNTPPTIGALATYTIPAQTPFALTASATDPNGGDVLTYCWEEFDLGAAQDPTVVPRDNGASPLFRSYPPTTSPTRLFPSRAYILENANVPPATVGDFATGEFLPTTSRIMTFRVTVRDNRAGGGGSDFAATTVTSTNTAGPFAITSHNTAQTLAGGSTPTITWSVANTDAAPVSCANVKITLSTDGGNTFPMVLAASTVNNGSAVVTIPNTASVATNQGRIKIEAVGNIFFDISDADLTITTVNTAPMLNITGDVTVQRGTPTAVMATIGSVSDPNTPLTATVSNVPADAIMSASISGSNVNVSAMASASLTTTTTSRTYAVTLTVADALGAKSSGKFNLVVQPNPAPTVGIYADRVVAVGSNATITPSAAPADANNNLGATPCTVVPTTLPGGGTLTVNQTTGAVTATTVAGTTLGTYPVRVTVQDNAGAAVEQSFNLLVAPTTPVPVAGNASAPTAEDCVPANNAVDPDETVTVNFTLRNDGGSGTGNLVATLQSSGGVAPITSSQNYGAIASGGSVGKAFSFTASGTCGGTITATFQLQDGATNYGNVAFTIRLGVFQAVTGVLENFDGIVAPALPNGWVAANSPVSPVNAWKTENLVPDTGVNSVMARPTSTASDNWLDSPNISIVSPTAQVSFAHRWNLQSGFDGGVLEISINGGAFADIIAAGGSFAANGYNGTISGANGSPIAGRQAWTGNPVGSYATTVVNLPAAASGQSVKLRWRLGSDSAFGGISTVWNVDTILLTDGLYACCDPDAPVFTSALPANGTVDVPYTHTFTANGAPAPTFAITAGTLPAGLALEGAVLSGTPTVPGVYPGLTVTASNGVPPNATQNFSLTIANTYAHYIAAYGFSPANADAAADPDGDGIGNVAEYGLNLVANVPNRLGLPVVTKKNYSGTNYLSMTFTRMTTATDLTYAVQVSPDLTNWTDVAVSVAGGVTSGAGFVAETGVAPALSVEVKDTTAATPGTKRFMRLKVTR
jgi:hypothetical protein